MKKTFTQFRKLTCLILFACSIQLFAQPLELKIDDPSGIAGRYPFILSFNSYLAKPTTNFPLKQALLPDTLGCTPITTDLTGTIAILDRGTCIFATKIRAAQAKGAVSVIICNTATGATNVSIGTDTVGIRIPAFLMTKANCDKIKVEMRKGTVTGGLSLPVCNPSIDTVANAIWGTKTGEGDFAGGIGTWTIETPAGKGWQWSLYGDASKGAFAGEYFIGSKTSCNGAMVFDSDFLDNSGDGAKQGSGTCPGPCTGSFTSPNIDLSGVANLKGLSVQFTQSYRHFFSGTNPQTQYWLLASYDNGIKWDTIKINTSFINNSFSLGEKIKVGLCGADLSKKQVKLRFLHEGRYYFWSIDDVFLINDSASDVQVNSDYYAIPFTFKTPKSQVSNFPLLSDIKNNGPSDAPNTVLTASVSKVNGTSLTEVYNEKNNYNSVKGCDQIENIPFPNNGRIPSDVGRYQIDYSITTSGIDDNITNNKRSAQFLVTENSFSNCINEVERGGIYLENLYTELSGNSSYFGKNDQTVGQYYFIPKGKGFKATRMYFGVEDSKNATGAFVTGAFESVLTCDVYKVKPGGTDTELSPTELTQVGQGFDPLNPSNADMFIDTTTASRRRLYFSLKDMSGKDLNLEDNTGYVFLIKNAYFKGTPPSGQSFHLFPYLIFNHNDYADFDTDAVEDANNIYQSKEWNYGGILNNGDRLIGNQAYKIYNEVIIEPTTVDVEEPLAETAFNVYPNPASSELFVDIDLVNTAKKVTIELTDITGRVLTTQNIENVKSETLSIPVSKIPSGVYLTKISTPEGSATKKVIIAN